MIYKKVIFLLALCFCLCLNLWKEKQKGKSMFDNEMRKKLIQSLIRSYYQLELNAKHHEPTFQTYERLEFEMGRLMTKEEYETFFDCNEFEGVYYSDI